MSSAAPNQAQLNPTYLTYLCSSKPTSSAALVDQFVALEATAQVDPTVEELLPTFYCAHLLSLFLDDDLNEARFLAQRISQELQEDPSVNVAIQLLKALYRHSYEDVYINLASPLWPVVTVPLRDHFAAQLRERTCSLLARAYTSLSPGVAAYYLSGGKDSERGVVDLLVSKGWKSGEDNLLHPPAKEANNNLAQRFQDDRIGRLTALVAHLTEE